MTDTEITNVMQEMVQDFADKAEECIRALFLPGEVVQNGWGVADHLEGKFDYIFTIRSENPEYASSLVVGIALSDMNKVTGCQLELDEAKDAFGEFGNNYCALINDIPLFEESFGILRQRPPQEAVHRAFFPPAPTISGFLNAGSGSLYLGYSINKNLLADLLDF